ncbi:MAG: DUF1488 family protein [Hyphomicrobiales bacterium]
MGTLVFSDDFRLFDGECVRFHGVDGGRQVLCGVTTYALKHHVPGLPLEGLLPGELFLEAYDKHVAAIHEVARRKYSTGSFEKSGDVEVMVHDHDWHAS